MPFVRCRLYHVNLFDEHILMSLQMKFELMGWMIHHLDVTFMRDN
jgi:hypothetical protein